MIRVLVTGAAGFSGRSIARRLVAAGCAVIAQRRRTELPADLAAATAVTDWPVDLAEPLTLPDGLDAVVHAAASSPVTGGAMPPDIMIRDNALATARLVAAAEVAGVPRFVYLSSLSVHGTVAVRSIDAATPIRDPDPYGVSKLMGESVLAASRLPAVAIRLPAVIGPGADRNWPVQVIGRIRRGETVRIYNADSPFNNVVHVEDLAEWVADLVRTDLQPGMSAVPVGSADPVPVRAAVVALAAGLGIDTVLEEVVAPRPSFTIDVSAAERLGFRPSRTLDALTRYAKDPDP